MKLQYTIMGLLALFLISPLVIMGYVVLLMGAGAAKWGAFDSTKFITLD